METTFRSNQSLQCQILQENLDTQEVENMARCTINEVNALNNTMDEFKNFFQNDTKEEEVNVKVMIDSVLLLSKDLLIKGNIHSKVEGDVAVNINTSSNEFKHVLINLQ